MSREKKFMKNILIYIGIILILVFVDQITKYIVFKNYEVNRSYVCIPHIIRFDILYNNGAIFGILQGKKIFFFIVTVLGLGVFGYMFKYASIKEYPFYTFGLCLMVAGTIGNFIDRFLSLFPSMNMAGVRDFITFDFFRFASFNFADMCMTVGVVLLAIEVVFGTVGERWK